MSKYPIIMPDIEVSDNISDRVKREDYVDYAKSLAILLVVSGHVIYISIFNRDNSASYNLGLFYFSQLIDMPLFYFFKWISC